MLEVVGKWGQICKDQTYEIGEKCRLIDVATEKKLLGSLQESCKMPGCTLMSDL